MFINFSKKDLQQLKTHGLTTEAVDHQLLRYETGFPAIRLNRAATVGDGILQLQEKELRPLHRRFDLAAQAGRISKFVPASGAASRMFRALQFIHNQYVTISDEEIAEKARRGDPDHQQFREFMHRLPEFPFYPQLRAHLSALGADADDLRQQGHYKPILSALLEEEEMNLAALPKGLIPFHRYNGDTRTAFEEHFVEAMAYAQDERRTARLHFTISAAHEQVITEALAERRHLYEQFGVDLQVSFSTQKPSTDTIAVDENNKPVRQKDEQLLFRPGGHGALLENLNELHGDIVFIKNIDNVVPDRLKGESVIYKKALGGMLIDIQERVHGYLRSLAGQPDATVLAEAMEYATTTLHLPLDEQIGEMSSEQQLEEMRTALNRPIRICGVVPSEGEPGGGPFWVEDREGRCSLQIIETAQANRNDPEQVARLNGATHFNPVDLVCGLRDYQGKPFDLNGFVDGDTGFICRKSWKGQDLKVQELPGLWNGAMAGWITLFVEVPLFTFNPVKTVLDLLRPAHQPAHSSSDIVATAELKG